MKKYKIDLSSDCFQDLIALDENYILDPIDNNKNEFNEIFKSILGYKIEIKNSWLNKTFYKQNTDNTFLWHNEKGVGNRTVMPGAYSGVCWIYGEEDSGGSLDVLDEVGEIENIPFKVGTFIVFKSDLLHRVNHYSGSIPRVSLNITFDKI